MSNGEPSRNVRLKAWAKAAGKAFLRFSVYLVRLLWEAIRYLGQRFLDLIYLARLFFLNRARRRFPQRAGEMECGIVALREKRTARWARWRAFPTRRRLEVQAAAVAVLVAFAFALNASFTAKQGASAPLPVPSNEQIEKEYRERRIAELKESLKKMPGEFEARCKDASPGQWVFYGANRVEYGRQPAYYEATSPVLLPGSHQWAANFGNVSLPDVSTAWDDFKVTSPVVLKEGERYRMWYVGCHFLLDDYTCGIGHATSSDGVSWEKTREPLFLIEDRIQSKELDGLAVVRADDRYLMWYSIRADWFSGNYHGTLHMASSVDGLHWQQEGKVLTAIGDNTFAIAHSALYDGKVFHLWYVDVPSPGGPASIVHFTSSNGKEWQIAGSTTLKDVGVDLKGRLWVLADGHGGYRGFFAVTEWQEMKKGGLFAMLVSSDGNSWRRADEPLSAFYDLRNDENSSGVNADAPIFLPEPNGIRVWFVFRRHSGQNAIAAAYRKEGTL